MVWTVYSALTTQDKSLDFSHILLLMKASAMRIVPPEMEVRYVKSSALAKAKTRIATADSSQPNL
jgi:hypothetical protein